MAEFTLRKTKKRRNSKKNEFLYLFNGTVRVSELNIQKKKRENEKERKVLIKYLLAFVVNSNDKDLIILRLIISLLSPFPLNRYASRSTAFASQKTTRKKIPKKAASKHEVYRLADTRNLGTNRQSRQTDFSPPLPRGDPARFSTLDSRGATGRVEGCVGCCRAPITIYRTASHSALSDS